MALARLPGVNPHLLAGGLVTTSTPSLTSVVLDAAADRLAFVGRFTHESGATRTVDGLEFLLGTVSKAGGSTLHVSLQDVSTAAGPVMREDGTPDQLLTIANADAGFVTNAWYGGDFDSAATRTLAIGELVCVVFQFGTFLGTDSAAIRMMAHQSSGIADQLSAVSLNTSGSVTFANARSNVVFRCTDGSFGTLSGAWPCTAVNTHTFGLGTGTADEYALSFQCPFPFSTDGVWANIGFMTSSESFEVVVYSGTTALRTVTIVHRTMLSTGNATMLAPYAPLDHAKDTLYRLAFRPLGTDGVNVWSFDVNDVAHMSCLPGGTLFYTWTRLDQGGTWTAFPTRRLMAGPRFCAFDDGAGGGGSGGGPLVGGRLAL